MSIIDFIKSLFKRKSKDSFVSNDIVEQATTIEKKYYPFYVNSDKEFDSTIEYQDKKIKGAGEDFFYHYLANEFPKSISNRAYIKVGNLIYEPDFLYIDKEKKVYIDIEIDEPYTLINNKLEPIHFLGSDDNRNSVFLSKGIHVLRFAEEQIFKTPEICINSIKEIVEKNKIETFENKISCWSLQESNEMIQKLHRNNYLPSEYFKKEVIENKIITRHFKVFLIKYYNNNVILNIKDEFTDEEFECWIKYDFFISEIKNSTLSSYLNRNPTEIFEILKKNKKINYIIIMGFINKTVKKSFINLFKDDRFKLLLNLKELLTTEIIAEYHVAKNFNYKNIDDFKNDIFLKYNIDKAIIEEIINENNLF